MIFLTLARALSGGVRRRLAGIGLAGIALLLGGAAQADALFDGSAVSGCTYDGSSKTYSCTFLPSGYITINSGYTVNIAGSASMGSALINGTLTIGGALDIAQHSNITGNISVAGSARLNNQGYLNGNLTVGGSFYLDNQSEITGNLDAGGDITIDNHAQVDGNLSGHNVEMYNAFAKIGGNARVNSIIIGNKGEVDGTISCTAPGANGCSCVTDNSGNGGWAPSCAAPPPSGGLDHILITHSGSALTCQPQTVTLTACANASCTAPHYSNNVAVSLSPGGNNYTISGGINSAAQVSQASAGNATLSASVIGSPGIGSSCLNTANNSTSCSMTFATAGLVVQVPNHKSEASANLSLYALQQGSNPNACVAALSGTRNVNFSCSYVDPASAAPLQPAPLRINGTPLAANATSACGSTVAVSVTFDNTGLATPPIAYSDVGKMNLNASVTTATGAVLSGSGSFIVAPDHFQFTAVQGAKTNPAASDDTGGAFVGAGQMFTTTLAAANALNATTYNFGREQSAEYAGSITPALVAPNGGAFPGLRDASGYPVSFPPMSNGSASATMYYNEVGIISFSALLNNTNGYLYAGAANFRTSGTTNIGRFIPDHFNTAITSTQMACNAVTSATTPCPAANTSAGKFLYASQPFDMTVTAYSANNTVTTNYAGLYAKAVSLEVWKADATPNVTQNPGSATGTNTVTWVKNDGSAVAPANYNFAATAFTSGIADSTVTTIVDRHPRYDFAAIYPATTNLAPPTSVYLRAKEGDGSGGVPGDSATSLRLPVPSPSGEALVSFVSGRLLVNNTYGNLSVNSPVKVTAQYWSGNAYVNNPAFVTAAATPLAGKVTFSNCQLKGSLNNPNCVLPTLQGGAALTFSGGSASFNITQTTSSGAPTAGTADVTVNALLPYLPSAKGTATFGVYRAGPVVYMREVF